MKKMIQLGAVALALVMTAAVAAQDKPAAAAQEKPAAAPAPRPPQVPVKVQLVLTRFQGDKKISSVPYMLWVTTNDQRTSLRMGVQIAIPSVGSNASTYTYKDVGTNIDCGVMSVPDGYYKVIVTVTDSSVYFPSRDQPNAGLPPTNEAAPPAFRSFNSTFSILLRDGQTAQYTSVTDPVSGEVLKIDATLNVLK